MRKYLDLSYGSHPMQKIDLWLPDSSEFELYIHFHGGGLETGDRTCEECFPVYLTQRGIGLASVEYRMYPDAVYPDFIEDAAAAVAWITQQIHCYGKAKRVFIGGCSAGGYLSMMLCFDRRWLAVHGLSPMDFSGFIHDAGQPTAHFTVLKYRGIDSRRVIVDETAPLYHIGVDETYPPMRFLVSDHDMENRLEQTHLVLSTLRHFGYDLSNIKMEIRSGTHTEYCEKRTPSGESLYGEIIYHFIEDMRR